MLARGVVEKIDAHSVGHSEPPVDCSQVFDFRLARLGSRAHLRRENRLGVAEIETARGEGGGFAYLRARRVRRVDKTAVYEFSQRVFVKIQPFALPVRREFSAELAALVPEDARAFYVGDCGGFVLRRAAVEVDVVDSQNDDAVALAGAGASRQERPRVPDVQKSRSRRRDPRSVPFVIHLSEAENLRREIRVARLRSRSRFPRLPATVRQSPP